MKQYLEAFTVREDNDKNFWTRIGVVFPNQNGGLTILLDAIPAPTEGQYKIVALPPKAEEAQQPQAKRRKA